MGISGRGAFGFAFEVAGVSLEDGSEVWQRSFDEWQHQAGKVLLHRKARGSAVTWRQLEGADALEHRGEPAGPGHFLAPDDTGDRRREDPIPPCSFQPAAF